MESILETKASTIVEFFAGLSGTLLVTFEEGTWAACWERCGAVASRSTLSGTCSDPASRKQGWSASRRTISGACAKLCHDCGGELEQIQFLLGHASVQTTERYLGCKQNLGHPVNDLFDLRTDAQQAKPRNLSRQRKPVKL
jgi:hypothetical protein